MTYPLVFSLAQRISSLRGAKWHGAVSPNQPISDGVYFSWDDEMGEVAIDVDTRLPDKLAAIAGQVRTAPRWLSLNIELGASVLKPGDMLGLVIEHEGGGTGNLDLMIRTGRKGTLGDTKIAPPLPLTKARSVVTLLHRVAEDTPLTWDDAYHTLVIHLPKSGVTLDLCNLTLFVVPAGSCFNAEPGQYGGAA